MIDAPRTRVREGKSTRGPRVNPKRRTEEFPNEHLRISAGKLFRDVRHAVVQPKKKQYSVMCVTSRCRPAKEKYYSVAVIWTSSVSNTMPSYPLEVQNYLMAQQHEHYTHSQSQ